MWAIKSQKYWLVLVKNFHHKSETGSDVFNWHHNDRILYIWGTHWVPFSWRHLHLGRRVKHLVLRDLKNKMATQFWSNNIVDHERTDHNFVSNRNIFIVHIFFYNFCTHKFPFYDLKLNWCLHEKSRMRNENSNHVIDFKTILRKFKMNVSLVDEPNSSK